MNQHRGRNTLLGQVPYLRAGTDADRNAFWVITSIVAFTLLWSIIIDLVLHRHAMVDDAVLFWLTAVPLIPALLFVVIPWFAKTSFPRSVGSVGYFIAILVACSNIAFSNDAVLAITALHILPICALYLGWFWKMQAALIHFTISVALVLLAVNLSSVIGVHEAMSPSTVVFGLLLAVFAFTIGLYLRYQLRKKALTDQLTGAWNARGIRRALSTEIGRALKRGEPLSVAYCDFDNFKALNDLHGHAYGDAVLTSSVQSWVQGLRPYDIVGRLGGDEFVMIFPRTTKEQAAHVLHRIQTHADYPWTWGISEVQSLDSVDSLLKRADQALYQNKHLREVSPTWLSPQLNGRPLTDREPPPGLWQRILQRQTEFSIVSSLLAVVVFGGILASILGGDYSRGPAHSMTEGWISLALATVGVIVPLAFGARYPTGAGLFTATLLLAFYTFQSVTSTTMHSGIVLMFSLSLVALYLGTFSGTMVSRFITVAGVITVVLPILNRAFTVQPNEDEPVVLVTALYSLLMCIVLFELGSYLYNRSRTYAHHDELTGALNRHGLNAYGGAEISRARRTGQPLAVVVIDCVGFKRVNDTHGHAAGDELLRELVIYLNEHLEMYDHVVRTGGDEFVLILPYRTEEATVLQLQTILVDAPSLLRYGVAELQRHDTIDSLISRADAQILDGKETTDDDFSGQVALRDLTT